MSKSDTLEADILKLIFNATPIANMADNAAVGPNTFLFLALHTADPGDTGTQNTSEATYTGYTRIGVARTSGGWTISGTSPTQAAPVANQDFPAGTAGAGTATYFSAGQGTVSGAAGSITCTSAVPGVFTWTAHGLSNNMPFYFTGTPPTGLAASTIYFVNSVTANTFQVSLIAGGASITTTGTGASMIGFGGGTATKILYSGTVTPNIVMGNGVTPRLTTASTCTED